MAIRRRALALLSGGLDSMLAVKVIQAQGIEVEGINFYTGFCVEGHTHAIRRQNPDKPVRNNALWSAEQLGIRLRIEDISEEYKRIVLQPRYGYGTHLNPCLDCKVFMVSQANLFLNRAREVAADEGFDFIITGEVPGQRLKSQKSSYMRLVASESGVDERLLRPLAAKIMPPTLPEREGWVDRDKLYGFSGRSRAPQIALAKSFGWEDWSQPAGGCCFLTDEAYSRKLRDLWNSRGRKDYELDDILMLKVGRHIRPASHYKLMIGREEGENNFLEGYHQDYPHIRILSHRGPLTLVDGEPEAADLEFAARIAARFCQGRDEVEVRASIHQPGGVVREITVRPLPDAELEKGWYV
jgi:tRNA U34 2-thiouridine synthase MnmA/TrmU